MHFVKNNYCKGVKEAFVWGEPSKHHLDQVKSKLKSPVVVLISPVCSPFSFGCNEKTISPLYCSCNPEKTWVASQESLVHSHVEGHCAQWPSCKSFKQVKTMKGREQIGDGEYEGTIHCDSCCKSLGGGIWWSLNGNLWVRKTQKPLVLSCSFSIWLKWKWF